MKKVVAFIPSRRDLESLVNLPKPIVIFEVIHSFTPVLLNEIPCFGSRCPFIVFRVQG